MVLLNWKFLRIFFGIYFIYSSNRKATQTKTNHILNYVKFKKKQGNNIAVEIKARQNPE